MVLDVARPTDTPAYVGVGEAYIGVGEGTCAPLAREVRLPFSTRSACVSAEMIEMIDETPIRPVSIATAATSLPASATDESRERQRARTARRWVGRSRTGHALISH